MHPSGRVGIHDERNSTIDGPYANVGPQPWCEKVCGSLGEAARVAASTPYVIRAGEDTAVVHLNGCDLTASKNTSLPRAVESSAPFDPGGSDCPWDRGRAVPPDPELLAKPWRDIQRCFDLHHLPFTRAEIEWLQSPGYDPEITIEEEYYWGDMHCVVDGKRLRRIPNRKPCELPLGPVTLQRIDYDALVSLPMPASEALLDALTWVRTDRLRREVMAHPDWKSVRAENRFHVSRHLLDDLPELHKQGLFAVHAWGPTSFDVPLFKVPKAGDLDSRLIGDCRDINVLIPKPGCMGLIALPDLIRRLLGKRVLYQRDARSYFYHFGLSPSASEVLSVRWGGHRGEFYTSLVARDAHGVLARTKGGEFDVGSHE